MVQPAIGGRPGRSDRTGARIAASSVWPPHESVHLLWLGDVHDLSFKAGGRIHAEITRVSRRRLFLVSALSGAGSIIHAVRGSTGLTSAATLFVVASIGMACGGGLYVQRSLRRS